MAGDPQLTREERDLLAKDRQALADHAERGKALLSQLYERLREYRRRGVGVAELAAATGMHRTHVNRIIKET